ncbi:MAG: class I SAM-dependent methyltransferase [Dehalococcoidia bacterium]
MTNQHVQTTDPVRGQFGAVAAAYATSTYHSSGPDLAALVSAAGLTGRERVLDLGCGAGHTALAVAPHAAAVMAVDLTPEMLTVASGLAEARGITNITFRSADVAALPFEDAAFDLITSRVSAHHYADPEAALGEAARVLRPGGSILLIDTVAPEDPALDTFYNAVELLRDRSHVRNCRVSEWKRLLAGAGFEPETLLEFTIELDGASWVERSRTPAAMVAAIRALFENATPAARAAFDLRDGAAWGWTIPAALIKGVRSET